MSARNAVQAAFETEIAAFAAAQTPPLVVLYDQELKDRPDGMHLRVALIPVSTSNPSVGSSFQRRTGMYQVDVCNKAGGGTQTANTVADGITSLLKQGRVLQFGSYKVLIEQQQGSGPVINEDGGFFYIPVTTEWRLETAA